jgi:hypothetical protein
VLNAAGAVQETPVNATSATLQNVEDSHGGVFPISSFPLAERSLATEAIFLLIATNSTPRASPKDAIEVLKVLAQADDAITAPTAPGTPLSHSMHPVLYALTAFALLLVPSGMHESQRSSDIGALASLTQSKELSAAVSGIQDSESGVGAIVRFVFGVAGSMVHERMETFEGSKAVNAMVASAINAGALTSLVRSSHLRMHVAHSFQFKF